MFEELRSQEFFQLNSGAFVDFGGSFPICQSSVSRIEEYANDLYSNYPSPSSPTPSIDLEIDAFRNDLLKLFNTDSSKYTIFFSENTSAVLRDLGHSFPWGNDHKFFYHIDNHNSVLGLRHIVSKFKGENGAVFDVPDSTGESHSLFAYSPQSNFNGRKYPLDWISKFQSLKPGFSHVLIDCAAYAPTCDLDLSEYSPDFVAFSLLKMFGVSGGALLVRNDAFEYLNNLEEHAFDKMLISAAYSGFKVRSSFIKALGNETVSEHVYSLASYLHESLKQLKHYNGNPLVQLYPPKFGPITEQGGTIAFNLFDSKGCGIPHDSIFTVACANNIFVRFGVHCNPGATYTALKWDPKEIENATKKHEAACSLTASMIGGRFVGSIRVSFGYISTKKDAETIVDFLQLHFLEKEVTNSNISENDLKDGFKLVEAYIHPIKGCRGVRITSDVYRLTRSGLHCDECWGVADEMSTFLDRRRCPKLSTLQISIENENLVIKAPDDQTLTISIRNRPRGTDFTSSTVCHEKINGKIYDHKVNDWFTNVLGQKAVLVNFELPEMKPFRAFFTASLEAVGIHLNQEDKTNLNLKLEQLKPHFIFESQKPFAEDQLNFTDVVLKSTQDLEFHVNRLLPMTTESMIDPQNGEENIEPLHSICLIHGNRPKPEFGLELSAKFVPSRKNPKELKMNALLLKA